jgi:hypothetical protein
MKISTTSRKPSPGRDPSSGARFARVDDRALNAWLEEIERELLYLVGGNGGADQVHKAVPIAGFEEHA